jgi:hypothetical protein
MRNLDGSANRHAVGFRISLTLDLVGEQNEVEPSTRSPEWTAKGRVSAYRRIGEPGGALLATPGIRGPGVSRLLMTYSIHCGARRCRSRRPVGSMCRRSVSLCSVRPEEAKRDASPTALLHRHLFLFIVHFATPFRRPEPFLRTGKARSPAAFAVDCGTRVPKGAGYRPQSPWPERATSRR